MFTLHSELRSFIKIMQEEISEEKLFWVTARFDKDNKYEERHATVLHNYCFIDSLNRLHLLLVLICIRCKKMLSKTVRHLLSKRVSDIPVC